MELELRKLNEAVTSIHDEMFYLRERYKFIVSAHKFTGARFSKKCFSVWSNGTGFCLTHSKSLECKIYGTYCCGLTGNLNIFQRWISLCMPCINYILPSVYTIQELFGPCFHAKLYSVNLSCYTQKSDMDEITWPINFFTQPKQK